MNIESLINLAQEIKDRELREKVIDLLRRPILTFTDAKPMISIDESPAAPRKHHFFTGGLIVHTYIVTRIALVLSRLIEETYGLQIDNDTLLATALLHDLFKFYQYVPDNVLGGYRARDDWYLAHDYAVVAELAKRGAPDRLIRALTEVHGQAPFTTIEGLVVHLADSLDARLGEHLQNMLLSKLKEYERQCVIFRAIDELIKRMGLASTFSTAINDPVTFRKLIEDQCKL